MAKRSGKLPLKKAPCTFDQETLAKIDAILKGNRGRPPQAYRAILEAFPHREPLYERFLKAYREGITPQDFLEVLFSPVAIKEHRPPKAEKRHRAGQEVAPGGKSSPAKKPPPSPSNSAPPAQASVSDAASPRASRAKKFSEPLPADWKQRLEQSIAGYSHHPKEQEIMRDLLRKKEVEEAAGLIWKASRKVNPKWEASVFLGHFQEVLSRLAIAAGLRHLTAKDFRKMAEALEMIRDHELFFRKGPAREELERAIPILRRREENMSKTKPRDPGPRWALQFLIQYFRDYLQKPLHQAVGLLLGATFRGKWNASTVRVRATEWAAWKDDYGLIKATAANTTKEAWAALDNLKGKEYEAAMEKMSPRLLRRYLQSGG